MASLEKVSTGYAFIPRASERKESRSRQLLRCMLYLVTSCIALSYLIAVTSPFPRDWRPWQLRQFRNLRPLSLEARAHKILTENPLIATPADHETVDGHNDLAILIRAGYGNKIYQSNFTRPFQHGGMPRHVDLPRIDKGQVGGSFWSAFVLCQHDIFNFTDASYDPVVRATLSQIDLLRRLTDMYPHYFTTPTIATDAERHWATSGRLISPLAIEGLHQIGNHLSNLRLYHALGVRYATLTWNCHNPYADAALLTFLHNRTTVVAPPFWHGVSPAGRVAIREMNRLGMMVDLAHVSAQTMRQVLNGTEDWRGSLAPPIFSHSSAFAVCPHPRNVPDDVLHLVKKRRSIVMINFSPEFIACEAGDKDDPSGLPTPLPEQATVAQVVRHIRHIGDLIGYEYVGIGSDFDGIEGGPVGVEDVSKFPNLVKEMLRQGISDDDAAKVVGRNILRVWKEVEDVARRLQEDDGVLPAEDTLPPLGQD